MHDLYKYCFQILMKINRRYTNNIDDAKDLMNQSFLKIINNLTLFNTNENFEAWISRIAINTCIDNYRKNKRYKSHIVSSEEQSEWKLEIKNKTENDALHRLNANQIYSLIDELPETAKQVFNLFAIDGYNHKEIAEMLQMTETTSRWYLHKARNILQEQINKLNKEHPITYATQG